jgi:hypothetical protein
MWDLKIDTRRLADGFSTSVPWDRPNVLWNKADDWWNDNYVTDSNTAAFLSATGIIDPNKQNYINNLVIALKNQGIWNKAKAIYPFVSEQRNLLNNTEDFTTWLSAGGGPLTPNYGVAPNNTLTASRFQGTSSGRACRFISSNVDVGTTYTFSIHVKSLSGTQKVRMGADNTCGTPQFAQTFTIGTTWTRVSATFTSTQTNWNIFFDNIESGLACTGTYLDMDILVWGVQLELGSTATDYQVTINAQEQFAAAYKYNLKDPQDTDAAFRLKIFGTWTFTPTGAKPNGTNAYMDTCLNASTHLTTSSGHLSYYSRTNAILTGWLMGAETTAADRTQFIARTDGAGAYYGRYGSNTIATINGTTSLGLSIFNRPSSSDVRLYQSSGLINTTTYSASGLPNLTIYLAGNNSGGTANAFCVAQCACASIGSGLSDSEALALQTIIQQFQVNWNRAV